MGRWRAAWSAFRTYGAPRADERVIDAGSEQVDPMASAVGLVTECLQPGGGDLDTVNALLRDVRRAELAHVAAAAAVLASTLGREWAAHDSTGPGEVLACIGLAAARRGDR